MNIEAVYKQLVTALELSNENVPKDYKIGYYEATIKHCIDDMNQYIQLIGEVIEQ